MRLRALTRSGEVDRTLLDEMRDHLDHLAAAHVDRGMTPEAARAAARREFGPVPQLMDESRDARGVAWIANAAQDMKYGVRMLKRSPGFATAAVLTVALGMGATTGMFSIVYGVLLQPLPFDEPDRLVNLWSTAHTRGLPRANVGMANVYDWRARSRVFEDIAAFRPVANFNLTGQRGEPERLNGARVEAKLFRVLRVAPLHGRMFTEDEDEIGREDVAILSYGLWHRRFGGDPAIVGRTILLSGRAHTVVGVMGRSFAYPTREYQIWTPLTFDPKELVNRLNYSYHAVGRLKPGVSLEQARAEMNVVAAQIEREHPKENVGIGAEVAPMHADTVAAVRTPLFVLLAAVTAMLLIGCANLANLLLARALARQRELAVRAALGAGRGRLVAQSIAELVPMLAAGGALGIVTAAWAIRGLIPLLPPDVPRAETIGLQWPVLAGAAATLAAVAVFVGIWPALDAAHSGLSASAADLARGVAGGIRRTRARDVLVVAQIAATLWLAIGAMLLTRSFTELKRVNPGFSPDDVYGVHLAIPRSKYPSDRDVANFCRRVLDRVQALPDVVAAAMVNRLPLAGGTQTAGIEFEGIESRGAASGQGTQADLRTVTPDYFRTLQIPLVAGRTFTETDSEDAPPVGIIDDRIAKATFGDRSPIGRRFRVAAGDQPWITVVGVVGHIRHDRLDDDGRPQVYWNYRQRAQDRMALAVRTRADAAAIGPTLAAVIRSVDPEQPVYDARTLSAVVDRSLAQRWLQTAVLATFAGFALLLASIGVYGVISYAVGQRLREFGIRLALGARPQELVGLVMRKGTKLFAAGAAFGTLAAVASGSVLASLLYNVRAFDAASFAAAAGLLLAVAFAACYVPARRAARVDPTTALRAE
jgi:putative ABC transport system permease protein